MQQVHYLDPAASLSETAAFLQACTGGVTLREFNKLSRKPLIRLHKEIAERGVRLYRDPETGYAFRIAHSTKALIINPVEHKLLLEVSREYTPNRERRRWLKSQGVELNERGNEVVPNYPNDLLIGLGQASLDDMFKVWSFSETRKHGETPLECLRRGGREEFRIDLNVEWLRQKGRLDIALIEAPSLHDSSTYFNVKTLEMTTWIRVYTSLMSSRFNMHHTRDNGTIIHHVWTDPDPSSQQPGNDNYKFFSSRRVA